MSDEIDLPDILGDFEELVFKNIDIEADEFTVLIPDEGMGGGEAIKKAIASRVLQAIAPFLQ